MPRIIGGTAKGRVIALPPGDVRPATARVKQSLFDYISGLLPQASILDLYCGSGALGFESISRGATRAEFVDLSGRVIETVESNARTLGFTPQIRCHRWDVFKFLRSYEDRSERYEVIFISPPYKIAEPERLLKEVHASSVLTDDGVICLEYSRHNKPINHSPFELCRQKIYGETILDVWEYPEG